MVMVMSGPQAFAGDWSARAERRQGRLVDLLCDLIALPSENPPGNEGQVAEFLGQYVARSGAEVRLQEVLPDRPNLLATWRFGPGDAEDSGPVLALVSHLDVVPAPPGSGLFKPEIRDGRVWGRGACDAKGSLAAMMVAAECLQEATDLVRGTLVLAALMGEETGGLGARALVASGFRADAAIIGEPTDLTLVTAHRGKATRRVTFRGRAAHAAQAFLGQNAVVAAARFISLLAESEGQVPEGTGPRLPRRTQITPTVIQGGLEFNVVPAECRVDLDCRLALDTQLTDLEHLLNDTAQVAARPWPGMMVRVETVGKDRNPVDLGADHPLVHWAREVLARHGGSLELGSCYPAATDQGVLLEDGNPTFALGPGALADAHTDEESVAVVDLVRAVAIFAALAHDAFSGTAPPKAARRG